VRAAGALAPACASAFVLLRFVPPAFLEGFDLGLWSALALEGMVIWAVLLAAGVFLVRMGEISRRPPA
jgi:hypothetical protein